MAHGMVEQRNRKSDINDYIGIIMSDCVDYSRRYSDIVRMNTYESLTVGVL